MKLLLKYLFLLSFCLLTGCYGFKGISIETDVKTFIVEDFNSSGTENAPDIDQLFSEGLRRKIRNESKLVKAETDPDIIFNGTVLNSKTTSVAPKEGNTTSLNRFEIFVSIEYINIKHEDESWEKRYSAFQDYDRNDDFNSIQDALTDNIIEDIVERIFNDAFTNW